ncbi:MAG: urea amidolyase associated protein UAAP1 [Pseudomonadota bacterium]
MTGKLGDPIAAKEHARAMAGTVVQAMPTLPPVADDLPDGVEPKDLLWEETIAAGGYAIRRINRGGRLRLIDLEGDACASFQIFNAEMPTERLNIADTVKVQWNGYFGVGEGKARLFLSDMGRVLMSILEDTAGTHDGFCGASNEELSSAKYGKGEKKGRYFLNTRDRFLLGVGKHGLGRKDVHPCVNLFKGAVIEDDGAITPQIGPFEPGRQVILRAEMDLMLVIANCPHVMDPREEWTVTPLRATAWRAPITPEDDPVRNATPESLRAYLNVEDYYRR